MATVNKRTLSVATLSYSSSEEPEDRQNRNIELKFKVLCSGGPGLYVPGPGWRGDLRRVADSRLPGRPGGPGCGNLKFGELG